MEETANPHTNKNSIPQGVSTATKVWLFFVDTIQSLIFGAIIFFIINFFFFRPYQVSGSSMYSTFKDSEYVLTNVIALRFSEAKKGDVIVFKSPTDAKKDFIKRIIAVPGDTIEVKNGEVYVNDKKLDESTYLDPGIKTFAGAFLHEGETKKVPKDEYAVMGDNRIDSSDFRQWGFVSKENIKGISMLVYWPLQHMRLVKNPYQ